MSDTRHPTRLHELTSDIDAIRHLVTTLPRLSPIRIGCIQALASALHERYNLLKQVEDLEPSILYYTEAIFLSSHLNVHCSDIAQNFLCIAQLLLLRSSHTMQPEDVKCPVIYLRYLREQSPEVLNISPEEIGKMLVHALALQVGLEVGDVVEDIEEMADLCLELLNSGIGATSSPSITCFAGVIKSRFGIQENGEAPPAKAIDCLRKANICLPDLDELSFTLARILLHRFEIGSSGDDYEEGRAILDKFLTTHAPEDDPTQYREALELISMFAQLRLNTSQKPEHLEEAIYRLKNYVPWIPLEDPTRPYVIHLLTSLQSTRVKDFGVGALQLDEEHSLDSLFSGQPSFGDLITSLQSPSEENKFQRLSALFSASRMTDMAEIEEAIEPCRRLFASFVPGDEFKAITIKLFGDLLHRAFQLTNDIEYLNEAISIHREGLNLPYAEDCRLDLFLISFLFTRHTLRSSREDLDEIMQLYQIAVDHRGTKISDRFQYSCDWAQLARIHSHPSTSTAYDCSLSSMQDSLTFAPTVDIQHSRLVTMRRDYETLPLDYASYQVDTGQLQGAVETLERGRALIWSEMRGLRSSIDQLRASDSELADKLTAINQDLEALTLTFGQSNYGDGKEEGLEGMDPFSRLVLKQRGLLDDRDKLISQIRTHEGFESFLKPLSFDDLRSATERGPVIIINHNRWRSDIIILLHDSPPSLVPTADDFYDRANELRDQLLDARGSEEGPSSVEYDDALRLVLKELYELVGQPVIQRLNELHVPEQSRVWWCPTSAFCSLPLHAMGPIPPESDPPRYFLDLYIPSYTPTLSALIESNKSESQTSGKPSLLLVVLPDEDLKSALSEARVVQSVDTQVKSLIAARATPTAVLKHLQDHRFLHIVCHGILEPGKPFDSSFKLYDKRHDRKPLTLLDIIRSRLSNAEFAFLAACHTAELTDGSLLDEALHLTAAMQYCGFRSVVGTMWAMLDKDGRRLAQNFYDSVFPPGETQGTHYYERTAEALRDAVIILRKRTGPGMTLERWVNFVHYGA